MVSMACTKLIFNSVFSPQAEEIKLLNTSSNAEIVFIPMIHMASPSFYQDVAGKVDSLNGLGYFFIYEWMTTKLEDSIQKDLLIRKYRKLWGVQPSLVGRIDTSSQFFKIGLSGKEVDLMHQPEYSELNLDFSRAICGDPPLETLINAFEVKNGLIELSNCDLKTDFEGDYKCSPLSLSQRLDFLENYILGYRDSVLVESFISLNQPKVAIIYGANHYEGFYKRLRSYDGDWKVVKK
jgi:hypothetical protein